jgi:hypothetical protein
VNNNTDGDKNDDNSQDTNETEDGDTTAASEMGPAAGRDWSGAEFMRQ